LNLRPALASAAELAVDRVGQPGAVRRHRQIAGELLVVKSLHHARLLALERAVRRSGVAHRFQHHAEEKRLHLLRGGAQSGVGIALGFRQPLEIGERARVERVELKSGARHVEVLLSLK